MNKPKNTRKYPDIPESKKDTRKYPIVFFDTTTRPEHDPPLPSVLSNTRPDPILKNPTRWALVQHTLRFLCCLMPWNIIKICRNWSERDSLYCHLPRWDEQIWIKVQRNTYKPWTAISLVETSKYGWKSREILMNPVPNWRMILSQTGGW